MFQFQIGAIKRVYYSQVITPEVLFQFQIGAIKSAVASGACFRI